MSYLERLLLIVLCLLTASASAAVVLVFDRDASREPAAIAALLPSPAPPPEVSIPAPSAAAVDVSSPVVPAQMSEPPARLETVALRELPPEGQPAVQSSPADNWPEATVEAERDDPDWWTADVNREIPPASSLAGPRVAPAPQAPLPWQKHVPAISTSHEQAMSARLLAIGPTATERLAAKFATAKTPWPPEAITLVGIKDERALELYARPHGGAWTFVHRYSVLAASGEPGPKLRKGDKQVPEGVYAISFLNPQSRYHVSLRVNYPNAFDRKMAEHDGRTALGGDIMIHGKNVSAGCLAVGDTAAEELFVLASQVGLANAKVIIAPTDFRRDGVPAPQAGQPPWLPKLYAEITTALADYKKPSSGLLSFFKF